MPRRWAIEIRGKPLAEAPNRQLAVFPTIRRPCTDFLTGLSVRLPACLPACACLPVPTCLCLPVGPTCRAYLSGLPVWAYLSGPACLCLPMSTCPYLSVVVLGCLIWFGGKVSLIKGSDWFDWLIDCIDSNCSLWAFAGWYVTWGREQGGYIGGILGRGSCRAPCRALCRAPCRALRELRVLKRQLAYFSTSNRVTNSLKKIKIV